MNDQTDMKLDGTSPAMWGNPLAGTGNSNRGAWLRDSRFAMFIHWGPYSLLGGQWQGKRYFGIAEWLMRRARIPAAAYAQAASRFNPTAFDPDAWVRLAKTAGMRHLMVTAKHHDGFAMWHSAASPFNIFDATPFGRDPLAELAAACKREGLRLGFYYSQTQDWHEPDAVGNDWDNWPASRDFRRYFDTKVLPQVTEVLTHYGPVAGIWFDTPGPLATRESAELVHLVHQLQPDCLVNSRVGNGLGDYDTLGDQEIPRRPRPGLWEAIDTHNDSWGYCFHDTNWKSAAEIVRRLARVVACGGTYMLNVGPDGEGRIPPMAAAILRQVGTWTAANGNAVHGAGPSPFGCLPWGECTTAGERLFLHVCRWPADGRLLVPGLACPARATARLNGGTDLVAETGAEMVTVVLPDRRPAAIVPVVVLDPGGRFAVSGDTWVLPNCPTALDAGAAETVDCTTDTVRWMEGFGDWHHAEYVGDWRTLGGVASWAFRVSEDCDCRVCIDYSAAMAADGSEWTIEVAGQSLHFTLEDTGERMAGGAFGGPRPRFRAKSVGWLSLTAGAPRRLDLRCLTESGAAVRIRTVTLGNAHGTLPEADDWTP